MTTPKLDLADYRWSASAGRYVPSLPHNVRALTNTGLLLFLGVSEEDVTGQEDSSGISWEARYRLLLPRTMNRRVRSQ